ncbi:TetR family transcriptional regulator C-terminal domain-containing protein [Wenyingzhuangia sp. IMCC45533]
MSTKENLQNEIISKYMEHVLENGEAPKSIYSFTKTLEIDEKEFYNHYSSFESVAKDVYSTFFDETLKLISADESYHDLDARNKLLVFYFTFFEMLTANRSYVIITLKENKNILEKIKLLNALKVKFKEYVASLEIDTLDFKKEEINEFNQKSLEEFKWKQLVFTIQFWLDDTSNGFEKTDLFIEKSVNASFDVMNLTPIKSIIDFGKFFFKEKIKPNL